MDLFILKTDGEKFTSTNKKTLHLIFKNDISVHFAGFTAWSEYEMGSVHA